MTSTRKSNADGQPERSGTSVLAQKELVGSSQLRHVTFRDGRFFGSLDGLRAVSVIAVIWHHAGPAYDDATPRLLTSGHHGVTLFFAISGFLIVTLLLRERERTGQIDLKAFYIRRSLRIFPLYYAVVAIYAALVLAVERDNPASREFFSNLPFFLTYTSNWFVLLEGRVIFYFAWSLAAEEQFYLLWPAIQKFLTAARALAVVATTIVVVTGAQLTLEGTRAEQGLLLRAVTGVPLAICFGVVMAHAFHERRSFDAMRWAFASRWSVLVWLAALLASVSWPASPEALVHAAAATFVGSCVYREDHALARFLQMRWLAHVGAVSYGIYLMHMLVKNAIEKLASAVHIELSAYAPFMLTTLGSIVVASLSFRYFEARFLRIKHRDAVA